MQEPSSSATGQHIVWAMARCHLAMRHFFGPQKDRVAALAVLRAVVESGITHIDTSVFYGPHITNQMIREALHPYADDLTIVTKVGAVPGSDGSWHRAMPPAEGSEAQSYGNVR